MQSHAGSRPSCGFAINPTHAGGDVAQQLRSTIRTPAQGATVGGRIAVAGSAGAQGTGYRPFLDIDMVRFVFGDGGPEQPADIADGIDNFVASATRQPTAQQTIVSGGLQLGCMSKNRADNIGRTAAIGIHGALSAEQTGKLVAKQMGKSFRRKAVTSSQSNAPAAPTTARVSSRTPIVAKNPLELDTNMLIAATRADDPGHGLVMAFLESKKEAVKVVGAPALREAGAKTGNSLIKRTLEELGIRADISGPVESLTQLAKPYMGAFSNSESKLKADAFNLASAQMAGRTLVTRDIQFGKRPVDLGITDIRFVGSPENIALVARYGRSWPSPYST
jgi:predicted nucleic acid-binding protein